MIIMAERYLQLCKILPVECIFNYFHHDEACKSLIKCRFGYCIIECGGGYIQFYCLWDDIIFCINIMVEVLNVITIILPHIIITLDIFCRLE